MKDVPENMTEDATEGLTVDGAVGVEVEPTSFLNPERHRDARAMEEDEKTSQRKAKREQARDLVSILLSPSLSCCPFVTYPCGTGPSAPWETTRHPDHPPHVGR